jgi:ABC-type bacteriocin/lantibiotic exporter with double-glycine peptidase domain
MLFFISALMKDKEIVKVMDEATEELEKDSKALINSRILA